MRDFDFFNLFAFSPFRLFPPNFAFQARLVDHASICRPKPGIISPLRGIL